MEKKTIGKFIAVLRKANGMTQKDLADRLFVSDKTVSRWERDEGAPDLSLIPVIAELFGVTCDELLRGERRPAADRAWQHPHALDPPDPPDDRRRDHPHGRPWIRPWRGHAPMGRLRACTGWSRRRRNRSSLL